MLETASEWIIQTSFPIFAILGLICILQAVSPSLIPPPCQHSDVVKMTPSSKTNTFTFCTYRAAALQRHKCIHFTVIILFCRQNLKTESKTLEHRSCWLGCGFCVVRGTFYLFFPPESIAYCMQARKFNFPKWTIAPSFTYLLAAPTDMW